MNFIFYGCYLLKTLNLSSFYTNNVNNMSCMFCNCSSLQSLDISSFNFNKVIGMNGMFHECNLLRKDNIKINNKDDKILNAIEYL